MNFCSDSSNDSMEPVVVTTAAAATTTNSQYTETRPTVRLAPTAPATSNGIYIGGGGDDYNHHTLNSEELNTSHVGVIVGTLPVKPQERYVWEMRTRSPNVTPASTVLNSPDLNTDMQYTMHHHHLHHHNHHHQRHQHQIRVGHSPGSQFEQHGILPQGLASPGSPTDVGKADGHCLRDGEIVVFDDIDTSWMNKAIRQGAATMPTAAVAVSKPNVECRPGSATHHYANMNTTAVQSSSSYHSNEDVLKVTKMIGQLPIAEYEGSPRRFGNAAVSAAAAAAAATAAGTKSAGAINYPKRPPGFPQRVSPVTPPEQRQQQNHLNFSSTAGTNNNNNNNDNNNMASDGNKSIGNLIDLIDHEDELNSSSNAKRQVVAASETGKTPTFDYLYEFSETRKVLEEFFKANPDDEKRFTDFTESGDDIASSDIQQNDGVIRGCDDDKHIDQAYIGQRLARIPKDELYMIHRSPKKITNDNNMVYHENEHNDIELYIDSNSRSSGDLADTELEANLRRHSRNFTLSPETTDYDSNCGDLDSLSNDINCTTDYGKLYTSMPVLEDGLSSGHASDTENNVHAVTATATATAIDKPQLQTQQRTNCEYNGNEKQLQQQPSPHQPQQQQMSNENEYNNISLIVSDCTENNIIDSDLIEVKEIKLTQTSPTLQKQAQMHESNEDCSQLVESSHYGAVYAANFAVSGSTAVTVKQSPPPPPAPVPHRPMQLNKQSSSPPPTPTSTLPVSASIISQTVERQQQQQRIAESVEIQEAMKEIRSALQRAKTQPEKLKFCDEVLPPGPESPVWVPRKMAAVAAAVATHVSNSHTQRLTNASGIGGIKSGAMAANNAAGASAVGDDEEADTDLETDRLLGQQRLDERDFFDDKSWSKSVRHGASVSINVSEQSLTGATDLSMLSNNNNSNSSSGGTSGNGSINNNNSGNGGSVSGACNGNGIKPQMYSSATIRQGIGTALTPNSPDVCQIIGNADVSLTSPEKLQYAKSPTGSVKSLKDAAVAAAASSNGDKKTKTRNKEGLLDPKVLIEGVLFRARYLGSTQLVCEGQPTKSTRMMQAEEAVSRIKAPEGESQPSTEVDLFISTEKIMVLNTDLKEIMMDHALRTISYIADIGDLVVLMARRRFVPNSSSIINNVNSIGNSTAATPVSDATAGNLDIADGNGGSGGGAAAAATAAAAGAATSNMEYKENTAIGGTTVSAGAAGVGATSSSAVTAASTASAAATVSKHNRTPKMICHVFESDEAQFIAQSIGQAFQVAYMEFLKANGIENENLAKEMDYQEVLNSQEIFGDELEIFAKKELQKEVVVPKAKGEILGVVIVESGWGSMLPTVVIANLMSGGAAARCGQLNIGDQLIAINGMSLVGLPLSTCQSYIRNAKNQTAVKFTVVPCPPVVEVKILRPKALFQLGFSVQNGVICSLLRGGIAERGGVRVGHRIIEINNQSVVAVPHDTIVKLLSSSVGEILMKTMPTSMFRLLTGQETPIYI